MIVSTLEAPVCRLVFASHLGSLLVFVFDLAVGLLVVVVVVVRQILGTRDQRQKAVRVEGTSDALVEIVTAVLNRR